jgi:hypothetical protein
MIGKNDLVEWLKEIDNRLDESIEIIAVGGTAMTLIGLKSSTRDVDFEIAAGNEYAFKKALDDRFKVDIFTDGYIFSVQLPEDFKDKASDVLILPNLLVKTLSPEDIIITKTARLNARDEEDIAALSTHIDKGALTKRFRQIRYSYAGNLSDFDYNFSIVIKRYFK